MKTKVMFGAMVLLLYALTGSVFGGTEGSSNTFYGTGAGAGTTGDNDWATSIGAGAGNSNTTGAQNTFLGNYAGYHNTTAGSNTFVGYIAGFNNTTAGSNTFLGGLTGYNNTTGAQNTFLGMQAGSSNTIGGYNTFLGYQTGYNNTAGIHNTFLGNLAGANNTTGNGNVFLGYTAGYNETGSNKLYIDNSSASTPLIYGEFDNNILTINGNLKVIGPNNGLLYVSSTTADSTTKVSRMVLNHYSNAEEPVYLFGAASTSTNNFVALGGGNTIGNAATQIDLFTAPSPTTPVGYPRMTIIGNGYVGIGIQDPVYPLEMAGGAYSNGGSWIDGSSRQYKEDIEPLTSEEAFEALEGLDPVKYAYKKDRTEKRVGFIAEDVPDLVATKDRKGLSSMDIVAVLTKVLREQQKMVQEQQESLKELRIENRAMAERLLLLEGRETSK